MTGVAGIAQQLGNKNGDAELLTEKQPGPPLLNQASAVDAKHAPQHLGRVRSSMWIALFPPIASGFRSASVRVRQLHQGAFYLLAPPPLGALA